MHMSPEKRILIYFPAPGREHSAEGFGNDAKNIFFLHTHEFFDSLQQCRTDLLCAALVLFTVSVQPVQNVGIDLHAGCLIEGLVAGPRVPLQLQVPGAVVLEIP